MYGCSYAIRRRVRAVVFLDELPGTANGKVLRRELVAVGAVAVLAIRMAWGQTLA